MMTMTTMMMGIPVKFVFLLHGEGISELGNLREDQLLLYCTVLYCTLSSKPTQPKGLPPPKNQSKNYIYSHARAVFLFFIFLISFLFLFLMSMPKVVLSPPPSFPSVDLLYSTT